MGRLPPLDDEDLLVVARAERRSRGQAYGLNAWKATDAVGELRVEQAGSTLILLARQPDEGERHAADERVLRTEARIHLQQLTQAAKQQPGANQEHDRQRELRDDERVSELAAPSGACRSPAVLDRVLQLDPRTAKRGRDAEEHDGHERHDEGEREHRRVERHGLQVVEALHGYSADDARAPRRDYQADCRSREPEQQALDEQLSHDSPRAGAEAAPHGDLAAPGAGTHEQEVGDVGTRDQEDHGDRSEQHEQWGFDVADELARQRRRQHDRRGRVGRVGVARRLTLAFAPKVVVDPGNLPRGAVG